jgi:hypothetical protein
MKRGEGLAFMEENGYFRRRYHQFIG